MIDEITFEVLRHRLDTINDDAASVLARLSGSHLAAEARDLNTAIMAPDGRVVCCGRYVLAQVVSMHLVVRDILDTYADNPGFGPGDQFVTNDPYVGTLHQPDVVVVAPVFVDGELVAWCGSTAHQADVGGPNPGGITYDARSIFDEAVPMPPVRIVEGGRLRRDLEREYLIRSRTAELNRLDLVGQVAANRSVAAEIDRLCGQYGAGAVAAVMDRLLERTEALLRERLRALPDGRWRHTAYVEYRPHGAVREEVYAVRLVMTKRGDDLELDFTGSDAQAPGAINAAYPALAGFAIGGVLIYLCGGLPWVPGGVWPVVRIRSREGTVVHARWPAGVAMSTAATCQAIRVCVNACVARMLEASRDLAHLVMASCQAAGGGGGTVHGVRPDGTPYATMTLDEITGGGGATWDGDGADSSGYTTSPGASCANVEVNEAYLPLLYERRAELADTGGPGRHRGGVGTLHALTPHGDGATLTMMSFGQGLQHPLAAGVCGGEFGGQSVVAVVPGVSAEFWGSQGSDASKKSCASLESAVSESSRASEGSRASEEFHTSAESGGRGESAAYVESGGRGESAAYVESGGRGESPAYVESRRSEESGESEEPVGSGMCGESGESEGPVGSGKRGGAGEWRLPMPSATVPVHAGELLVSVSQGGGGLGDPLERDPDAVLEDVVDGLVSVGGALRDYGVVITGDPEDPDGLRVDGPATARRRDSRRAARIGRPPAPPAPARHGVRLSASLDLLPGGPDDHDSGGGRGTVACGRCATALCRAGENAYEHLVVADGPVAGRSPLGAVYDGSERFVIRRLYCPACALQIDVQVCRAGDPITPAVEPL